MSAAQIGSFISVSAGLFVTDLAGLLFCQSLSPPTWPDNILASNSGPAKVYLPKLAIRFYNNPLGFCCNIPKLLKENHGYLVLSSVMPTNKTKRNNYKKLASVSLKVSNCDMGFIA